MNALEGSTYEYYGKSGSCYICRNDRKDDFVYHKGQKGLIHACHISCAIKESSALCRICGEKIWKGQRAPLLVRNAIQGAKYIAIGGGVVGGVAGGVWLITQVVEASAPHIQRALSNNTVQAVAKAAVCVMSLYAFGRAIGFLCEDTRKQLK